MPLLVRFVACQTVPMSIPPASSLKEQHWKLFFVWLTENEPCQTNGIVIYHSNSRFKTESSGAGHEDPLACRNDELASQCLSSQFMPISGTCPLMPSLQAPR
eukprot:6330929-Amphidinium_carterae.1